MQACKLPGWWLCRGIVFEALIQQALLVPTACCGRRAHAQVASEPRLLLADSGALVRALVALVAAFPKADVADMVQRRPSLMLLEVVARWALTRAHASLARGPCSCMRPWQICRPSTHPLACMQLQHALQLTTARLRSHLNARQR